MTYWEPEGFHQLGEGNYTGISARDVLNRMREATGTASQRELADWLGVRQSLLSDAQRRDFIPIRWLQLLIEKQIRHNSVWILTGQGEKLW